MNGYISLLKPPGMSSAAAVAFVKRLLGEKCGHAGTLDPEVAGVLPIMAGRATRLQQYFSDKTKAYIGEISFTGATDTQDAQGTVIEPGCGAPAAEELEAVIRARFLGDILQSPPMYSAVKRDGKPLYAIARSGGSVQVEPRPTHIYACEVLSRADSSTFRLRVECGAGTYIRTLFHDIGQALGRPAHMRMLIRTRSGCFTLANSVTCEALASAASSGQASRCLLPMDWPLSNYRTIQLTGRQKPLARNGVPLPLDEVSVEEGETVAVYDGAVFYGMGQGRNGEFRLSFIADP